MGQKWGKMGQKMGQNFCNHLKSKSPEKPLFTGFSGTFQNHLNYYKIM